MSSSTRVGRLAVLQSTPVVQVPEQQPAGCPDFLRPRIEGAKQKERTISGCGTSHSPPTLKLGNQAISQELQERRNQISVLTPVWVTRTGRIPTDLSPVALSWQTQPAPCGKELGLRLSPHTFRLCAPSQHSISVYLIHSFN